MMSAEKEVVHFVKHVDPNKKNVEDWMGELENMMRLSVRDAMIKATDDYSKRTRSEWAVTHPGQVILNGSQIVWTGDVEGAMRDGGVPAVKEYWEKLNQYLFDLVDLVRTKLSVQAKVTINALIVIDVHAKDIVEKLWRSNINDPSSFQWISQLRYYWTEDNCFVRCIQTNFPYGY
jgi:dynein heavy chain